MTRARPDEVEASVEQLVHVGDDDYTVARMSADDLPTFVASALSPAKVGPIEIEENEATVTVMPDQLSLAIGKGGQNVRLAAKLTGHKIDLRETAAVSDLDAAMQQAMQDEQAGAGSRTGAASAFDALFKDSKSVATASPDDQGE